MLNNNSREEMVLVPNFENIRRSSAKCLAIGQTIKATGSEKNPMNLLLFARINRQGT